MGIQILDEKLRRKLRIGIPLNVVAAVRALLHNAYDAGATSIEVTMSGNGLNSIQVTDNGHGISEDDCKQIAVPYSTSKILTNEDLQKLGGKTLGFRGLDLACLAEQCSSIRITTRPEGCSVASVIELKGHPCIRDFTTGHHNRGTTVTVNNLFSTCPIRHEDALRRSKTDRQKLNDMLTASALSRPRVSVRLYQAGSLIWSHLLPRKHNLLSNPALDAASLVIGHPVLSQCSVIHQTAGGFTVDACLIRPSCNIATERRNKPFITVDGRPISRTKGIAKTLIKCYQCTTRLTNGNLQDNSSTWYLEIRCPEASYDVNVDPEKDDLMFAESATVERLWKSALEGSIVEIQESSVEAERAQVRHSESQQSVAGGAKGHPLTIREMSLPFIPHTGQIGQKESLVETGAPLQSPTCEEPRQTEKGRTERRNSKASSDPSPSNPGRSTVLCNNTSTPSQVPRRSTRQSGNISDFPNNTRPRKRARTSSSKKYSQSMNSGFRASKQQSGPRGQSARPSGRDSRIKAPLVDAIRSTIHDVGSNVTTLDSFRVQLGDRSDSTVPGSKSLSRTSRSNNPHGVSPQPGRAPTPGPRAIIDLQGHIEDEASQGNSSKGILQTIKVSK